MTPQPRTRFRILIIALLVNLICVTTDAAQQRRTRPRRTSTPQSQQPPPYAPAPQTDGVMDARTREVAALKALPPSQKTTIGETIWMLDNALRAWMMTFDKRRLLDDLVTAAPSITAAAEVLPQQGSLRLNMAGGATALLDALTAYEYTLNGRNTNEMTAIITRYNLRTPDSTVITAALTKSAENLISQARDTALQAGIPIRRRDASEQGRAAACTLSLEQAPEVRGFGLGMSLDEVRRRFPGLEARPPLEVNWSPEFGYLEARIHAADILRIYPQHKSEFKGVQSVTLKFLDGRVTYLEVEYDDSAKWDDVDTLLESLTASLNLPAPEAWQADEPRVKGSERWAKRLTCDGFKIVVWAFSRAKIFFHDTAASEMLSKRMRAKDERQRREFKP